MKLDLTAKRIWTIEYRADVERKRGNTISSHKNLMKRNKYCNNCKSNTHNTNECRHKRTSNYKKDKVNRIEVTDSSEEEFDDNHSSDEDDNTECIYKIDEIIDVKIKNKSNQELILNQIVLNNKSCIGLVDSGSTCTIINKKLAKQLKIHYNRDCCKRVKVLSNTASVYNIKKPIRINILGHNIMSKNKVYVSDSSFKHEQYQVILGMNILGRIDAKIDTIKGNFTLNSNRKIKDENSINFNLDNEKINFILDKEGNKKLEESLRQELQEKYSEVIAQNDFDVGKGLVETPMQEYFEEN
uniref:Peptidase A2 domain-containing protein n=1 Tax=Parastrongyloides trichosuri TaxID=131310 RepID=A0A0N4ZZP5_PARTI